MFGQWVRRKLGKNAENSILPLDLTAPEVIEDFASLATTELAQMSVCPLTNGGQLMLDPQDLKAAFSQKNYSNQPSRFSALAPHNSSKYVAAQVAANIPPFLDAPRHTVVRKWLSKAIEWGLLSPESRAGEEVFSADDVAIGKLMVDMERVGFGPKDDFDPEDLKYIATFIRGYVVNSFNKYYKSNLEKLHSEDYSEKGSQYHEIISLFFYYLFRKYARKQIDHLLENRTN